MNILLTGGRAPATLDLARAFHRAGHTVFMAESLRGHLSEPSNTIKASFVVPAPRQDTEAFLQALENIVRENQIHLLIPTCEEVFHIAKGLQRLPCRVFTEPLEKLDVYHNKWKFVINAVDANLRVPETILVLNEDDLLHTFAHWRELVLKPVYSRFASRTLILPSLREALSAVQAGQAWIAQEYIHGRQFCSYSVCQNGRITAHAVYPTVFTAGQGATIAFQPVEHAGIFEWVSGFVERFNVTGQMAFDFIQPPEGGVYALECNPRATSGVHLLTPNPRFVESFLMDEMDCVTPYATTSRMLATAMLAYGLPASLLNGKFGSWLNTFFHSDDVIFDFNDPLPFALQWKSIMSYIKLGRSENISTLAASTFDIEWNGEDKQGN
jgi:hypothetical protein